MSIEPVYVVDKPKCVISMIGGQSHRASICRVSSRIRAQILEMHEKCNTNRRCSLWSGSMVAKHNGPEAFDVLHGLNEEVQNTKTISGTVRGLFNPSLVVVTYT